jgi:hypothetical protein
LSQLNNTYFSIRSIEEEEEEEEEEEREHHSD